MQRTKEQNRTEPNRNEQISNCLGYPKNIKTHTHTYTHMDTEFKRYWTESKRTIFFSSNGGTIVAVVVVVYILVKQWCLERSLVAVCCMCVSIWRRYTHTYSVENNFFFVEFYFFCQQEKAVKIFPRQH